MRRTNAKIACFVFLVFILAARCVCSRFEFKKISLLTSTQIQVGEDMVVKLQKNTKN